MRKHIFEAFSALKKVYADGSYGDEAINDAPCSALALKLAYGVLENDVKLEYILAQCYQKKPSLSVKIILKIGAYALFELTDIPNYAIVSECVEVAKSVRDARGASGFVNAVLKRIGRKDFKLPSKGSPDYLSIMYSKPQWFIDRLIDEYGEEAAMSVLEEPVCELEHVRPNGRIYSEEALEKALSDADESYQKTEVGGYALRVSDTVKKLFSEGKITYQSPSSMLAVMALAPKEGETVLDACAAPGGKAVYISELNSTGNVIACDVNPYRVAMTEKYFARMRADNVIPSVADATKFNSEWKDRFNYVLADVPCSCLGTFKKRPDVLLTRGEEDISKLAAKQRAILLNVSRYVKVGGTLVYSTCTLFGEENMENVKALLSRGNFKLSRIEGLKTFDGGKYAHNDGTIQLLPHGVYDGFFIAKLKRVK